MSAARPASSSTAFDVGGVSYFENLLRDARGEGCSTWDADTVANALQWAAYFGRAVAKLDHSSRQKLMAAFDESFHPASLFDVTPHTAQACLVQALLASPFLPPSQLPGLLTRIAALNRRPTRPTASSSANSSAAAPAAECADVTVSEILAAVQKSALEVCDMARVGAATTAMLPLLQSTGRFSCMRAHARAAAAALVLTQDDALIQELCSLVSQSDDPLFFDFIVEILGTSPSDLESTIAAMTGGSGPAPPSMSTPPYRDFLEALQVALETRVLTHSRSDSALTSAAAAACIAIRPSCRTAAISAWTRRLLHALNTNSELLLLMPPPAPTGSFLTVLPDAADVCVRALVQAVNAAPPSQRSDLLRLVRHILFAQPALLASHTTAQAALDALSARVFIPARGEQAA